MPKNFKIEEVVSLRMKEEHLNDIPEIKKWLRKVESLVFREMRRTIDMDELNLR